jgi:hypothetical protein
MSVRRFSARPTGVSFGATGWYRPAEIARICAAFTPFDCR